MRAAGSRAAGRRGQSAFLRGFSDPRVSRMASPFKFFRKYQTWFYVVLGVFLMFAFVIADPLMGLLGVTGGPRRSGGAAAGEVIVRWRGQELTRGQIERRMAAEYAVEELLGQLQIMARRRGGMPRVRPVRRAQDRRELAIRLLMAEQARALGMRVSDEAIYDYLDLVSDQAFKTRESYDALLVQMAESGGRGRGVSAADILEQLRTDLLAERYMLIALGNLLNPSLGELWQYHQKLNRKIVCDLIPFPARDFLDQAANPPEDQLRSIFEEGKDPLPRPPAARTWFQDPPKSPFRVLRGRLQQTTRRRNRKSQAVHHGRRDQGVL